MEFEYEMTGMYFQLISKKMNNNNKLKVLKNNGNFSQFREEGEYN